MSEIEELVVKTPTGFDCRGMSKYIDDSYCKKCNYEKKCKAGKYEQI